MLSNENIVIQRINSLVKEKSNSVRQFAETVGIPQTTLNSQLSGRRGLSLDTISAIVNTYPDVSAEWLLRGEGDSEYGRKEDTRPRLPIEAEAGMLTIAADGITDDQCERMPVIRSLPAYDYTMVIHGDSMEPDFKSGDEVAIRLLDGSFIQWGRVHAVDTRQGLVIKRIYDGGDSVVCRSDNVAYPEYKVPKSEVLRLALVVGLVRRL